MKMIQNSRAGINQVELPFAPPADNRLQLLSAASHKQTRNSVFGVKTFDNFLSLMEPSLPVLISTWDFEEANLKGWQVLSSGGSALNAVEEGCTRCEELQCDGTVGYGGSPDEDGETTLDAMIMDGNTLNVGAVGCLRRIKPAIRVARNVMEKTRHTFLVGEKATDFAVGQGFPEESLSTEKSAEMWRQWKEAGRQQNFWEINQRNDGNSVQWGERNHDTIGMLALDSKGNLAAGTSTNGAKFKIPGRVGDSPIPGAGAYADNEVGAAAATGDGDVMMRILPSLLAVEAMRQGSNPAEAAEQVVARVARKFPDFVGAVVTLNRDGEWGAACYGIETFPFVVANQRLGVSTRMQVPSVILSG